MTEEPSRVFANFIRMQRSQVSSDRRVCNVLFSEPEARMEAVAQQVESGFR